MNKTFYQIFYFQSDWRVSFYVQQFMRVPRLNDDQLKIKNSPVSIHFLCVVDFTLSLLFVIFAYANCQRHHFKKYVSNPLINHHCQYLIIILLSAMLEIQFVFLLEKEGLIDFPFHDVNLQRKIDFSYFTLSID